MGFPKQNFFLLVGCQAHIVYIVVSFYHDDDNVIDVSIIMFSILTVFGSVHPRKS